MGIHKRPRVFTRLKKKPWCRIAKRPEHNYVRAAPPVYTRQFVDGNTKGDFDTEICLISKQDCQIRDRCLESIRILAKQRLEKAVSRSGYKMVIWPYPHHVLREHKTPGVASKAERLSKGMRHAFGRPIGRAARVHKGDKVVSVFTSEKNIETVKTIFKSVIPRLPGNYHIEITKIK